MIYTLGESLLDIIINHEGTTVATPGGAMLNVAVSLARAGEEVSLISETGKDAAGKFILDFLQDNRVASTLVTAYENKKTSLALAFLDKEKKPSYSFYKRYPAIRVLQQPTHFSSHDILLFGSLYSLDPAISSKISKIVERFVQTGGLLIFDPNIRNSYQLKKSETKKVLLHHLKSANIVKGSQEDFENIFGTDDADVQLQKLRAINAKALLIVTKGAKGAVALYHEQMIPVDSVKVEPVSTIGAGDGFSAGILFGLHQAGITKESLCQLSLKEIQNILQSGVRFATEVCLLQQNYVEKNVVNQQQNKLDDSDKRAI